MLTNDLRAVTVRKLCAGGAHQQRQSLQAIVLSREKAGKAGRLVVMLESLSHTGCGDAFAVVKVCV
jgi:hypothetical protein